MVQKHKNNRKRKIKKTMKGGKRTIHKKQKAGARSNYCLYSSKNLGTECSNWDGIVMLTKGLYPHDYLYKFVGLKKSISNLTSKEVIIKALEYANDYLGIFKLSYFIKTVTSSYKTLGITDRDYSKIRGRYSPRGFWNGTKESVFRNDELEDYNHLSRYLLNHTENGNKINVTFSINDLSTDIPWFIKTTNIDSKKLIKDSSEYICSQIKDKPVNLTFGTTNGILFKSYEKEMQVMNIETFIKRTFGSITDDNSLKSQKNKIFDHISGQLWNNFCGDSSPEKSIEEGPDSCKNSMKSINEWYRVWSGTSHDSRQPSKVHAIKVVYEYFFQRDNNSEDVINVDIDDQNLDEDYINYLTDKNKNREQYKLLSFDPFTNYQNISEMVDRSIKELLGNNLEDKDAEKNASALNGYVFGSSVGIGKRGIIQLEEFNYKILIKSFSKIINKFIPGSYTLSNNIVDFYDSSKIGDNGDTFAILEPEFNHPLLIDHIIVLKNNLTVAIVTPYYHLLKISKKLEGVRTGHWGIGNQYHVKLCIEYLKFVLCKRFIGDILDMYIYKYKNTMSHPRIPEDITGNSKEKIDGVQSEVVQKTTRELLSGSVDKGYGLGTKTKVSGVSVPTSSSFSQLEEFKDKLNSSLTYEELLEECKEMDIDVTSVESSTDKKEGKKKQLIILLVDKIFPSGTNLSQMIRHNEFIVKNTSNPSEEFIRENAYNNIDNHEFKDDLLVSKRDISSERIIPKKTFIRTGRVQMKCPFCGNLSVDYTKSKSIQGETVNPSNYDDGAYYYYCNNANCRAFLGAFYRKKDSEENKEGRGQIDGPLNKLLNDNLNKNFKSGDLDVYPNDGMVKGEINKLRQQLNVNSIPQYNPPDPQGNSPYYQMQTINQMNPGQQMFTVDGANQVGQQIGQSPPKQGFFGNINPFANTDTNAAMGMQSQIVNSPQGWNTTPYAQSGPGPENPVFTMGNYQVNAPGFGFDPNTPQMGGIFASNQGVAPGHGPMGM